MKIGFRVQRAGAAVSAVALVAVLGLGVIHPPVVAGAGWAQTHDDGTHEDGTHEGGRKGPGAGGEDGHEDGGHEGGGGGSGPGPQAGGEGSGGGSGQGGTGGTKPVWAQEGIPEVELGRLNVARSPDAVIDRAFDEALASFTPAVAAFYRLDLEGMEKELAENWDTVQLIDSPLQNLALMRDALDGTSILSTVGIRTDNDTLLAAFLGTASDKSIPVSAATAQAVAAILGDPLTPAEAAALAAKAERIRLAIVEGHG